MKFLLVAAMMGVAAETLNAQSPRAADEVGLSGFVVAPDETAVSDGRVFATRAGSRVTTAIDRAGRFRLVPDAAGLHQIVVVSPGFAPYRFNITVPPSRTVKLPLIRLSPATYFRARFLTVTGEPITSPTLRRRSVDTNGMAIPDPSDGQPADQFESDGTVTIGPLPRGITMIAVDVPPFAQTRLPDVVVTGEDPLLDAGVITIRPGAVLQADIVDAGGAPVPAHEVWIEDTALQSPLAFRAARTDSQGRAVFDRLAPGRYRLWTRTKERCGNRQLSLARAVAVGTGAMVRTRVVVGGRATFRFVSPLGPMIGKVVQVTPEAGTPAPWQPVVDLSPLVRRSPVAVTSSTPCAGSTDADGRVTLTNFPPGPANVEVRLFNSTYVKRVIVPEGGREVEVTILDGLISVHVANQRTNQPVAQAKLVWTGSGGRVEALATANGDALLEGVGTAGGQLAIAAPDYQPLEAHFTEPPGTVQEVALPPALPTRLQARVVSASGEPLANAVVELSPTNPMEISDIAVTDAKGFVTFSGVPAGTLRLIANAEGFVPGVVRVPEDGRDAIVLTLLKIGPNFATIQPRSRSSGG